MSSLINAEAINENFPVPGQDNDTQVFRDNFDSIKTGLRTAKTEITELQNTSARLDQENDFNRNVINNAILQGVRDQKIDFGQIPLEGSTGNITIDFSNGSYQIFRVAQNVIMDFLKFPGDPTNPGESIPVGVGKVTLEFYGGGPNPGQEVTVDFQTSNGAVIKSLGFPGFSSGTPTITLTSQTNPVIVEVWRHRQEFIFMKYVGIFA